MEPTEIDEFRKQVEEGKESNLTYVSFAISVLAVLVSMVTVLGHRTHTEAVLMQSRAADQWNEYQAKKIRQTEYIVAADLLSLQPSSDSGAVAARLAEYKSHDAKTRAELVEEQKRAEDLEADVAHAETKAGRYDLGEALLQIGVVLTSITLLTRRRHYFIFGTVLGLAGLIIAATALFVH